MSELSHSHRIVCLWMLALACGCTTLGCGDNAHLVSNTGVDAASDTATDAAGQADAGGVDADAGSDSGPDAPGDAPVLSDDIDRSTIAGISTTPVAPENYSSDDELEDFVLKYAVRFCNKLFSCESRAVSEYVSGAGINSPATCMEYYQAHYSPKRLTDGRDNGRLSFDGAAASACVDRLEQLPCGEFGARIDVLDDEFQICPDVFTGQAGEGEACFAHAECPDGSFCASTPGAPACQGVCQPSQGACGDQQCDPVTEYCDDNDTCQPLGAWGDACHSRFECNAAYYCESASSEPTCQPYNTGVPADTRCDPETDVCGAGTFCFPYYPGGPEACRRPKLAGGTCLEGLPQDGCTASTYCERGQGDTEAHCVPRKQPNEPCAEGRECSSGRCVEGACVDPATPCTANP